jgi:hypothetical protein
MTNYPLKRGNTIRLREDPTTEIEIENAGGAGIKVKGKLSVLWWSDRGKTWTSDKLDRQDAVRAEFTSAATGCGK